MTVFEQLYLPESWEAYFRYKRENQHLTKREESELLRFIQEKELRVYL